MNLFRGRGWCALLACALECAWAGVCNAGDTASVVLNGRTLSADRQYWTYSNITLVHADNKPFKSLMISLTRDLVDSDKIVLPSDTSKIKVKGDLSTETSKIVQITGSTDAEIAAYLRAVKFYTVNNRNGQGVKVVATPEDISEKTFYFEKTRHYYQYVSTSGGYKSWLQSYELAKNKQFLGRQGYLATVMSYDEDMFIYGVSKSVGWLGGTIFKHGNKAAFNGNDLYYDGFLKSPYWVEHPGADDTFDLDKYGNANYPNSVNPDGWYWACGPERGIVFFTPWVVNVVEGASTFYGTWVRPDWKGAFQSEEMKGHYFNWECHNKSDGREPNYQEEPCLTTLASNGFYGYASKNEYSWNNLRDCGPRANSSYKPVGFFVEYGNQLVGDTTETNPPKDWGVTEEPVPSIYFVMLEGVADAYYLASDVASNLWAAASIAALMPPDAVHTNFFGWSKTQGAKIPDLIDQQPIQGYVPALETVNLYPVWTDQPVVTGRLMTRKAAEIFQLKAIDCNRQPVGTLVVTDGGGTDTNLVCYAFAAPRGVYGFDVTRKTTDGGIVQNANDAAWVDLVTVETDSVMAGPDFTNARIWDTTGTGGKDFTKGLNRNTLIGRFSQARGENAKRPILFGAMPIFDTASKLDWVLMKFADNRHAGTGSDVPRCLYNRPEVMAEILGADGSISVRMKEHWHELAEARSPDFMQLSLKMVGAYTYFSGGNWHFWTWTDTGNGVRDTIRATDIEPALKTDGFIVAAFQDSDCKVSTTNLPWRLYRYYKGEDGVEHYDVINQRHEGSVYSDGQDLGEYVELHDGYSLLYLKRFGQFAFIDPTDVEIDPGEQYKQDESTWGWTNMTAYGEMKYDRMELTLHNSTFADDKILFPANTGWAPAVQPNQHQVYTNTTESTNVSICDIASNVLSKVRLELPSNGDDIYWSIKLYREDGYKPYEFDIGISNAWYVVDYQPGNPFAGKETFVTYKNVRTINPPLAGANLGFGYKDMNFYCWQRNGQNFLDDGQPFFDISKAFQTNYLKATWVATPVISGDCPTNVNASTAAKLVSLGATNVISGDVLYAGAAPGRYVATAAPGIYDIVYTDKDGLPHTELIELTEGRLTGPSFADDVISTGVENADAEPGFKLLAGGMRAYETAVYSVCQRCFEYPVHSYDRFSTPRFDLVSAKVTAAEREAFERDGATSCFAVRARMSMTFLSSVNPSSDWTWPMETPCRSDPAKLGDDGFYVETNILVNLVAPFDIRPFAGCTNTWAIFRRGDDGNVDTLTTVPNAKGEFFTLADDHIRLTVEKFGAFGIKTPDLTTLIDLGAAGYTNEFGVSYFPAAQGSGDRLYSSVRIDLRNFDASSAMIGMVEMGLIDPSDYGAEVLTNSTRSSMCVRFDAPRTAADIAAFVAHCLWVDADYSFVGADVTVSCFENDSAEGEAQYTSDAGHIKTRAAAIVFRPGTRGTVNGGDVDFIAPSNTVQYLIPAELFFELDFWKKNPAETVNTYFYGWEYDGEVSFGAEQRVLNRFRIGETNVLTAVWTNMPVIVGEVASDSNAVTVAVCSLTNLVSATIFQGGAEMNRYAQPMPAGRPYNVAVEYRDTVGGEVMSVETVLVTNDVVNGATYDSTGRVETVTRVIRPDGDPDFVLVGGLEAVTANAGHLASGAAYEALKTAIGGKVGTYYDFGLETAGAATASAPMTLLLPYDTTAVLNPSNFFRVYRYQDGAVSELTANEYAVRDGYLELSATGSAAYALGLSGNVIIEDTGTNTVRWLATLSRASVFGQLNLRKVSGDFAEMTEPVFLFQDRVDTNGNDSVMLWNGRLMEQTAGNHAATNKMVFGGVEFRYVVLEGLRQRFIDTPNGGLVKFGLRDESFRNRVNGGYRIVSRTSDPAAVNEESCIELVSVNRTGATSIPDAKDIDGVLGFLMWSVGPFTNHIALASGHQGGVTNYVQAQRKVMSLAPTSPWRAPSAGAVLSGPPMPPAQLNTALAVGAYVDDGSSPYAEIVEFSVDGDVISGRIEVGAGAQVGSLGANAVVVMLASDSPGGAYSEVGSVVCDAEGRFAIARPAGRSFFKVRINIKEVLK